MNKWECDSQGCDVTAIGCGGAIGLRALGWQFEKGQRSDMMPVILCPEHRTDGVPGEAAAESTQSLLHGAEREANACPICEFGDPVEDTPKLIRWSCGHWIEKKQRST